MEGKVLKWKCSKCGMWTIGVIAFYCKACKQKVSSDTSKEEPVRTSSKSRGLQIEPDD